MRFSINALLASAAFVSGGLASWRFEVENHFESQVALKWPGGPVPLVYDEVSHSYLRLIPKDSTYYTKNMGLADDSFYSKFNALQVFNRNIEWVTKKRIGDNVEPSTTLGIYYHNTGGCGSARSDLYPSSDPSSSSSSSSSFSSSSSSSTSTTTSSSGLSSSGSSYSGSNSTCSCASNSCDRYLTSSSSDYAATLVTGGLDNSQLSFAPSLDKKCKKTWLTPVEDQVTTPSGHTYVLFADSLVILDRRCKIVRTLESFGCPEHENASASRILVDECKGVFLVVTPNLLGILYKIEDFSIIECDYLFDDPLMVDFTVWNSAMDWIRHVSEVRFTIRIWVNSPGEYGGLWYYNFLFDCTCNKLISKGSFRASFLPTGEKAIDSTCKPGDVIPAIINDYARKADITVTRLAFNAPVLHIYLSKFAGPSYNHLQVDCFDLSIPSCIDGDISASGVTKEGKHDAFVVTFTPSLDMLRIKYSVEDNVVAPYY